MIVSTARGEYLALFEYVTPGKLSKFPLIAALSHVDLTGNPDDAYMYRTSDSMLGISYALYADIVVYLLSVVWCSSNSLFGFRLKRHIFDSSFSIHPVRMRLPLGENSFTSCLLKKTVQFASNMILTPTTVLVKYGMMYPVVGKSSANYRIGSVAVADDLSTCAVAVSTLICEVLVFGGPCGYDVAM